MTWTYLSLQGPCLRIFVDMVFWKTVPSLLRRVRWFNLVVLTVTPALALYGLRHTPLRSYTLAWAVLYYVISMLGERPGRMHFFHA